MLGRRAILLIRELIPLRQRSRATAAPGTTLLLATTATDFGSGRWWRWLPDGLARRGLFGVRLLRHVGLGVRALEPLQAHLRCASLHRSYWEQGDDEDQLIYWKVCTKCWRRWSAR